MMHRLTVNDRVTFRDIRSDYQEGTWVVELVRTGGTVNLYSLDDAQAGLLRVRRYEGINPSALMAARDDDENDEE